MRNYRSENQRLTGSPQHHPCRRVRRDWRGPKFSVLWGNTLPQHLLNQKSLKPTPLAKREGPVACGFSKRQELRPSLGDRWAERFWKTPRSRGFLTEVADPGVGAASLAAGASLRGLRTARSAGQFQHTKAEARPLVAARDPNAHTSRSPATLR